MLVPDAPLVIKDAGENRMLSQDNLYLLAAHCQKKRRTWTSEGACSSFNPGPMSSALSLCHLVTFLCFNILKCRREVNLICLTKLRGLNELIFC